ncbi:MAG: ATP-dependent Clp protease adaptor ClpS [Fimbriimonas ginsengisoli]|uniref:ATP-dependent Clp protease adaptor ClpS n=1 Tax=Fimbriimonas ginsengisoli TaxID=1005039 RepID=A0A931LWN5_FIMGI|nr:ATP-dependent Clp protease adaptor ClpS [Fimbriimonas ginsengisoli]MBI3721141.1 ATP-dependent Clp protease adaptor ClpS [Fimbriimonas ginsengisoli]
MSQTVLEPELSLDTLGQSRWMVTIFNNDTNSFAEVIAILIEATGCTIEEAQIEAWEAHTYGKAPVHFGALKVCDEAAGVISRIGVRAQVTPEWEN